MAWVQPSTRSTSYSVTAANWNEFVNNFLHLTEVNYTEITTSVTISATTVGTANLIVSSGSITYEAVPHLIEFWSPRLTINSATNLILKDGSTVLGTLGTFSVATSSQGGVYAARRLTPTAASHNFQVAAWVASTASTMVAGSGGAAGDGTTYLPTYIRVTRVPV